jgi:hypothetical protein
MGNTPAGERVQALVLRCSREETTFALVSCAKTVQVSAAADLFRCLCAAVTGWVRETASGREAYRNSSEDYNVGDLSGDLGDPDLQRLCAAHGVHDLTVDIFSCSEAHGDWTYDTQLVDAWELEAPEDDAQLPDVPGNHREKT